MSGSLRLRRATAEDAELLLAWRNDPDTRAASFERERIVLDDHRAWLTRRLADPDCVLLVIEREGTPSGSVRLERETPERAEIHIVVAAEARGHGLASRALSEASKLAYELLGVRLVRAQVRSDNDRSLRAFRAAGFDEVQRRGGVAELVRPARSAG